MVSFQCDSCSDVIKKPKLDQHHSRGCHASFTCIDCSQTFQTPGDWKGHTSCISEAQKYQKTLYRPKPNDGGREYQQLGSKGKFQRQGGPWTRPPRYQATGANGTPLGTPTRMSPVTVQPSAEKTIPSMTVPATAEATQAMENGDTPKPHKKRKAESADGVVLEAPRPHVTRQDESGSKDKKKKDKKKVRAEETVTIEPNDVQTESASLAQSAVAVESDDKPKKSKKSKKDKAHKETVAAEHLDSQDASGPSSTANQTDGGQEKKKKKKKSEKVIDEACVNEGAAVSTDVSVPATEKKKSKKRKREVEGVSGTVEDVGEGKKKKKKKAAAS